MKVFFLASFLVTVASAKCASCFYGQHPEGNNHGAVSSTKLTSPFVKTIHQRVVTVVTILSTPAVVLIGKREGEIQRCLLRHPDECEVFYSNGSHVMSLHVAGEYLYAGLYSGVILKCNLNHKESCKVFQTSRPETAVESLTSEDGFLYAGLRNGTVFRCQLHEPNSCQSFYELGFAVMSAIQFKKNIYFGLNDGRFMRCTLGVTKCCKMLYNMGSSVTGVSTVDNSIFAVTWVGRLWNCTEKSGDTPSDYCVSMPLNDKITRDLAYFTGVFYLLEHKEGIYTCQWANDTACTKYGNFKNSQSMAIAFGTYQMQRRYKNENTACTWQSKSKCPPYVTYYNEQQRAMLQVEVKDGRLYNSRGLLVDTTDADEGRSGAAAIFAMGPDGRILLSNRHTKELLHTSSLFAGSPVSGAGEMIVKNGVIEKIMGFSEHYLPDINLNEQVVESLRAQGYSDPIVSVMCCDDYEYGQIESGHIQ